MTFCLWRRHDGIDPNLRKNKLLAALKRIPAAAIGTLYGKLAAVLLGLFCLVSVLFLTIARFSVEMYQLEVAQKLNRDLAGHIASEIPPMQGGRANKKALYDIFHQIMIVNPSIEIYLLDPQGRILAFSAPPEKVKRQSVTLSPIEQFLRANAEFPILGDDPRRIAGSKIFSAAAIPARAEPDGYLYIILGGEEYDSIVQRVQGSYVLKLGASAILAILLFAMLTGLVVFALLTRRLTRLTASVEGLSRMTSLRSRSLLKPPGIQTRSIVWGRPFTRCRRASRNNYRGSRARTSCGANWSPTCRTICARRLPPFRVIWKHCC